MLASLLVPGSLAEDPVSVELQTPSTFELDQVMLLIGQLEVEPARMTDPALVRVQRMDLPGGTLWVCPAEDGRRGQIPPLEALQERCRSEDEHIGPTLTFNQRTWLQIRGNHSVEAGPSASVSLFVDAPGEDGPRWATIPAGDPMAWDLDQGILRFRPILGASEVTVSAGGERTQYNGTDWLFYYEGNGGIQVSTQGLSALMESPLSLELSSAPITNLEQALEPRVLTDIQDAVLGPEMREPVANASRLLGGQGRIPHLLNPSLSGYLNGTIGATDLDPSRTVLVHIDRFEGQLSEGTLEGDAPVRFLRSGGEMTVGTGEPAGPPWWTSALLWVGALGAIWLAGPRPVTDGWRSWVGPIVPMLGLLLSDLLTYQVLGVSGLALVGEAKLGVWLALLGFEALALAVAWVLLVAPLRIIISRLLPDRWIVGAPPLALAGVGIGLLIRPELLLAMGSLVARI